MRDFIQLFVNGKPHQVTGAQALWTLSDFLRIQLGLVGTKIVCNEGDCGACSVLVGRRCQTNNELQYRSVDSCIVFMHQLDQAHVVSIEGLGEPQELSAVQKAMVDCHGSQCGYCTPGFVVAMHGLFEENEQAAMTLSDDCLRLGLSGNLCRCTGYVQIMEAGRSVSATDVQSIKEKYATAPMMSVFGSLKDSPIKIDTGEQVVFMPRTLDQACEFKAEFPSARIVGGATDIGVQHNHGRPRGDVSMCLSQVHELTEIVADDDALVIGAAATWTQILPYVDQRYPDFADVLLRFGSPQIRNLGTIGGNLANASPIADSIPFLYVVDAKLNLRSTAGTRQVSINDFYQGYKQFDLQENELIESIHCPRIDAQELKLYKISKRRDMDISTFTAAFLIGRDGDTITDARIALGGVGPTVVRTRQAEELLVGKEFSIETMRQAGKIAASEITPISDVRGSDSYRSQLAENIFVKCFHDLVDSGGRSKRPGAAV